MTHAPKVYRVSDFIQWCIAVYHMSDTLHTSGSLHRCVGCWDCNRCDMYGIPHTDSDTRHKCAPTKKKQSLLPLWNQSCRHITRHKMARLSSKRRSFFSPLVLPIYNYLSTCMYNIYRCIFPLFFRDTCVQLLCLYMNEEIYICVYIIYMMWTYIW